MSFWRNELREGTIFLFCCPTAFEPLKSLSPWKEKTAERVLPSVFMVNKKKTKNKKPLVIQATFESNLPDLAHTLLLL